METFITDEKIVEILKKINPNAEFTLQYDSSATIINCTTRDGHFLLPNGFSLDNDMLSSEDYYFINPVKFIHKSIAMYEDEKRARMHSTPLRARNYPEDIDLSKLPKEERFEILEIREAVSEEERTRLGQLIYTGIFTMVMAASIYLNKEGIASASQNPIELLQSWPDCAAFLNELGPLTMVSIIEIIFHSRSYFKHNKEFEKLMAKLRAHEQTNMAYIPTNTMRERISTLINGALYDLQNLGRRK